jgi:hypothetical protein
MIAVCVSDKEHAKEFFEVAQQSQRTFARKVLVAKTPLPERNIMLSISLYDPGRIAAVLLERVYGFAFNTDFLLEGGGLRMTSTSVLNGLVSRVAQHNKLIKYYGIKIIMYVESLSEAQRVDLFDFLSNWCGQAKVELEKEVSFDLARDRTQFNYILENEHRRMVHGDIKAQYAYAVSTYEGRQIENRP